MVAGAAQEPSSVSGGPQSGGRRRRRRLLLISLVVVLALIGAAVTVVELRHSAAPVTDDWSTSLHDVERDAASDDTHISVATAPQMTKLWSLQTKGPVATTPTVIGGTAYFGSWDGNEYAVDARTGTVRWKTFIGVLHANPWCIPPVIGPSSPATVLNGVVYTGGADGYWYALDAATGRVDWRVYTAGTVPPGQYDGHFNWSGPLILGNYAYVGVASLGDCPLIQGQLLKINLTTHVIENTANLVPDGQVGGGIWTSPAYDPSTGLIYGATGTENLPTQSWAQGILAIDPATMEVKDSWKLPKYEAVLDSDFGTSTTLFTDAQGRHLLVSTNKNGLAYAFDTADLAAGPVWTKPIAVGGDCPTCGQSSVSSGAAGDGSVYLAGNQGLINGSAAQGTVRALDPATGAFKWQHAAPGSVIGALAYDNGMVLDGGGSDLEVLNASTGQRLFSYDTGSQIYAGPSVVDGVVYVGTYSGAVYAFALPTSTPKAAPADSACPSGFNCQDIGGSGSQGSESVTSSGWTIRADGQGAGGTADALRLISRPTDGDVQITAEITDLREAGPSGQIGLMVRQNSASDSPYYAVFEEPNNTVVVAYRTAFSAAASQVYALAGPPLPVHLMIQRRGDDFQAAVSPDGTTYTLLPGTDASLPLPAVSLAGVAVGSGAAGSPGSGRVTDVNVGAPGAAPLPAASGHPCPATWSCQDVGNPALVGDQTLSGGTWTVSAAGGDIWESSDQFRYVSQPLAGDGTVSARVLSAPTTSPSAKAGVMIRASTDPGSAYYAAYATRGAGIAVEYRDINGVTAAQAVSVPGGPPAYLRVARSGTAFTAYTSADGITWTAIPTSEVQMPQFASGGTGPVLAGLAVTSHYTTAMGSATFADVAVGNTAPPPPDVCPSSWTCEDIGYPFPEGSQSLTGGTWNIFGGGGDIWETADEFRLVSQPQEFDGTVTARVAGETKTDPWAKAGVMLRLSDNPSAPYYGVFVTPSNGVVVQYRSVQDGESIQVGGVSAGAPIYLRVARSGFTYTAYTSTDGVTWTAFPGSTQTIDALGGTLLAGMAVTSHNTVGLNNASFDSFAVTGGGTGTGLPYPWQAGVVGAGGGAASYVGTTFTVTGGGSGVGGKGEGFQDVSQPVQGNVSVVAQVSQRTAAAGAGGAGVAIRASDAPGSPFALVEEKSGGGMVFTYGDGSGPGTTVQAKPSPTIPDTWVKLERTGNLFLAYTSGDGLNWIPIGWASLPMASNAVADLVATGGGTGIQTATFDSVLVSPAGAGPLPEPWTSSDIGGPPMPGSATYAATGGGPFADSGVFEVDGSSAYGSATSQMQYVHQTVAGDASISARVSAQTITDPWARSGLMFRGSTAPGAPYVTLAVTPGNQLRLDYGMTDVSLGNYDFPNGWLRLVRTGDTFTAFTSADGNTWSRVGSATVVMDPAATVGLFASSNNASQLNTTVFDNVAVNGGLPPGWTDTDLGGAQPIGSADYAANTFTVNGSGTDVWGDADQANLAYRTLDGNGQITARIVAQEDTNPWAKTGIMIKASPTAGSPYAFLFVTPANGVHLQSDFTADDPGPTTAGPPIWLRLVRTGDIVAGYTSSDGNTWTMIGSVDVPLGSSASYGLAVCGHAAVVLNTSTFDNVSVAATGA